MSSGFSQIRLYQNTTSTIPVGVYTDVTSDFLSTADSSTVIEDELYDYDGCNKTVTGLSPGTQYWFWVECIDEAGNSSGIQSLGNITTAARNTIDISFKYNPGGPSMESGNNTNYIGAFLYYDGSIQEEILPDTRNPTNIWLSHNSTDLVLGATQGTQVRLVFKITQGNHVPDTGIDDVSISGATYNFNTNGDFEGWQMHDAGISGAFDSGSLASPGEPFKVSSDNGSNGPNIMVTNPGSAYVRYDSSARVNRPGYTCYFASPLFTL